MELYKSARIKSYKKEIIGWNCKANPPIIELQYKAWNSAEIKFHYINLTTSLGIYRSIDNIVNSIFNKNKLFLDRNKISEVVEVNFSL